MIAITTLRYTLGITATFLSLKHSFSQQAKSPNGPQILTKNFIKANRRVGETFALHLVMLLLRRKTLCVWGGGQKKKP